MEDVRRSLSNFALESTLNSELKAVRKYVSFQERANADYQRRMSVLETKVRALETRPASSISVDTFERRLSTLERKNLPSATGLGSNDDWDRKDWTDKISVLERKMQELNPKEESTAVRFDDTHVKNL